MHILHTGTPRRLGLYIPVALAISASTALAQTTDFIGKFSGPATLNNSVLFQSGPQIGLGTTLPLDFMSIRFNNAGGTQTGFALQNTAAAGYSGALMYDHTGVLGVFQGFNNSTKEYRINNVAAGGTINFLQGANSRFLVNSAGNVGIGTTAPGAKLEIGGATNGWSTAGWARALELPNASVVKWRTNGTTRFGIGQTAQGLFFINANSDDTSATPSYPLSILNGGRVGIGTSNPTKALVEIDGNRTENAPGGWILKFDGAFPVSAGATELSLYATDAIVASAHFAFSDARIKRIDGRSDGSHDLATLAGIEVTDYGHIDTVTKALASRRR